MKKAILISIRPEWVAKILNGKKTIEIRKTAPKCELPIDVYIYCTKGFSRGPLGYFKEGKLVVLQGKVVAKFALKKVEPILKVEGPCRRNTPLDYRTPLFFPDVLYNKSKLDPYQIDDYMAGGKAYAWHIFDLQTFDKPKELSDFFSLPETYHHDHESMVDYYERKEARRLKRAPNSWQYVEVEE